ncbi:hypothetical protein MMC06_005673 [Schaereria dolodes]|nr:hypothetical protein [Schaereria dolodes]
MRYPAYCSLCGGPFDNDFEAPVEYSWLRSICLLSAQKTYEPKQYLDERVTGEDQGQIEVSNHVDWIDATSFTKPILRGPTRTVEAFIPDIDGVIHYPLHSACLQIAQLLRPLTFIHTAFDVQCQLVSSEVPASSLNWPNYFFGARYFHDEIWNPGSSSEAKQFEADPIHVRNMTRSLLRYLRPLGGGSEKSRHYDAVLARKLQQLPLELTDSILQGLQPFTDPSLQCTRTLSSRHWKEALLSGKLIPWLWDLDHEACRRVDKEASEASVHGWDWELFARMLAQTAIFEQGNMMEGVPLGLRNRRRIWRIAQEL